MTHELSWPLIIESLLARRDLSITEATWSMEQVMLGEATPAQLAAFLVALRS
jgi:anthranilate phosphoribosyltransferase